MKPFPYLWFAPIACLSAPAFANEYMSIEQAQQVMFAKATHFNPTFLEFSDAQREQIQTLTEVKQRWKTQQIWQVMQNQQMLGWFMVDKVIGKHEFITYALALNPQGAVISIEILDYRESYGDEVRMAPWRQQFLGAQSANQIRFIKDIANISGATLSCRNVTNGVRRLLTIYELFLKTPLQR